MSVEFGWFVDWDGLVRKSEAPGNGYHGNVEGNTVEVIKQDGEVIYEATYWKSFDELEQVLYDAGVFVEFA